MQVLLIEDDWEIGAALVKWFSESGYECNWMRGADTDAVVAKSQQVDAIVLDRASASANALDLLHQLRSEGVETPLILLTAIGALQDRIAGLNLGADDCMAKPFDFSELLARMHAVVRRKSVRPAVGLAVNNLKLDITTHRVTHAGDKVDLTPIEFSLLELLMRHAGQVVTRKMFCERVWGFSWEGTTNVIEVHVNRIRKKLADVRCGTIIKTVRARGYSVVANVHA